MSEKKFIIPENKDLENLESFQSWKEKHNSKELEKVVKEHENLIHSIAKKYSKIGINYNDIFSEGLIGLLVASERFKPEKNIKFSTYAFYWIRSKILNFVRFVKSNENKSQKIEHQTIGQKFFGKDWEEFESYNDKSFENLDIDELIKYIHLGVNQLSERERFVIYNRILTRNKKTLHELAEKLNITRETVRNIEQKSIKKIKQFLLDHSGIEAFISFLLFIDEMEKI